MSCIFSSLEKQIVFRASRLIRVCRVRCFRSIFWVFRFPTTCRSAGGQVSLAGTQTVGVKPGYPKRLQQPLQF